MPAPENRAVSIGDSNKRVSGFGSCREDEFSVFDRQIRDQIGFLAPYRACGRNRADALLGAALHRTVEVIGAGGRHDIAVGGTFLVERIGSALKLVEVFDLGGEFGDPAPFDNRRLFVELRIFVAGRIAEGDAESVVDACRQYEVKSLRLFRELRFGRQPLPRVAVGHFQHGIGGRNVDRSVSGEDFAASSLKDDVAEGLTARHTEFQQTAEVAELHVGDIAIGQRRICCVVQFAGRRGHLLRQDESELRTVECCLPTAGIECDVLALLQEYVAAETGSHTRRREHSEKCGELCVWRPNRDLVAIRP